MEKYENKLKKINKFTIDIRPNNNIINKLRLHVND